MEGPIGLITLEWTSDCFVVMQLWNWSWWQSLAVFGSRAACVDSVTCELCPLIGNWHRIVTETRRLFTWAFLSGLGSLQRGRHWWSSLESGKVKFGTVFISPVQPCQSQSFLNNGSPFALQQSGALAGCQFRASLAPHSMPMGPDEFPYIWYLKKDWSPDF